MKSNTIPLIADFFIGALLDIGSRRHAEMASNIIPAHEKRTAPKRNVGISLRATPIKL
jgi:hypothetical protein